MLLEKRRQKINEGHTTDEERYKIAIRREMIGVFQMHTYVKAVDIYCVKIRTIEKGKILNERFGTSLEGSDDGMMVVEAGRDRRCMWVSLAACVESSVSTSSFDRKPERGIDKRMVWRNMSSEDSKHICGRGRLVVWYGKMSFVGIFG